MIKELRKKKAGFQDKWTIEEIVAGLEKYKEIYHCYPKTSDFIKVDFLPSVKLLQRKFGGIIKFKETLNLDCDKDCRKGENRRNVFKKTIKNSIDYEYNFFNFLISKIPEIRVHEHKILRPGHVCCDFFVYTSDTAGFAIDIFYAQDLCSVMSIINIKNKRYGLLSIPVYYILVGNESIKQNDIDKLINNKKLPMPPNVKVLTEEDFKSYINSII